MADSAPQSYLGDGVYGSFHSQEMLQLDTRAQHPVNTIWIEPDVLKSMLEFVNRHNREMFDYALPELAKIRDLLRRGLTEGEDVRLDYYVAGARGTGEFIEELYRIFGFDHLNAKPEDIT